jgi:hypothetical protein
MSPNPVLRRLGFADDDRVVIIHTDDIGMGQATVSAFADLVDFGLISSGAVMVPCPWFPQAGEAFLSLRAFFAKQSPPREWEIASAEKCRLAMTRVQCELPYGGARTWQTKCTFRSTLWKAL